jgi:hypothetical protein
MFTVLILQQFFFLKAQSCDFSCGIVTADAVRIGKVAWKISAGKLAA